MLSMKTGTRDRVVGFALALVLMGAVIGVGCSGENPFLKPEAVAGLKDQAAATQAQLDLAKADAAAKLAKAQADAAAAVAAGNAAAKADAEKVAAAAQKTLDMAAQVQAQVDRFTAVLSKAINPDGTINVPAGAAAVGAALPPPWNLITMIGVPLAVGLVQQIRVKEAKTNAASAKDAADQMEAAARSLVNSIDVVKSDPAVGSAVRAAFDAKKEEMHEQLTETAKRILVSEKVV